MSDGPLVEQMKRLQSDLTFRRKTRRRVAVIAAVVVFDLLVSFFSVAAFLGVRHQQEQAKTDSLARRTADCHAMDDVGTAIKAGLSVLPDDPRTAEFVIAYGAAVDAAVVTAKARKGYSADCSHIGNPPGS